MDDATCYKSETSWIYLFNGNSDGGYCMNIVYQLLEFCAEMHLPSFISVTSMCSANMLCAIEFPCESRLRG